MTLARDERIFLTVLLVNLAVALVYAGYHPQQHEAFSAL